MTGTNPEFVWQQFSFLLTSFQKGLIPNNDSDIFQTKSLIQFLVGNLQKKDVFFTDILFLINKLKIMTKIFSFLHLEFKINPCITAKIRDRKSTRLNSSHVR